MEITMKFSRHLGVISGEKDGKEWQRVQFLGTTMDGHSRIIGFTAFGGERVLQVLALKSGDNVVVTFYPESREFNDRVFTDLHMVKIAVARPVGS